MRIRPFFWFLFLCTCMGVLTFALVYKPSLPAILQVHLDQTYHTAREPVIVRLQFSDQQGLPIDEAQVHPEAYMTNMAMPPTSTHVTWQGHGQYTVQIDINMAGPWAIKIQAQADGFSAQQQTLYVRAY